MAIQIKTLDELKIMRRAGLLVGETLELLKSSIKVDGKVSLSRICESSKVFLYSSDFMRKISKVWKKIKDYRQSGLESESGEYSVGNLVFKLLRRNGYVGKIMELKRKVYDNQFK